MSSEIVKNLKEKISVNVCGSLLQNDKAFFFREARLTDQLQETQHKLDGHYPELQSLQDDLQNTEMQNNLLDIELTKKNEEIQNLKARLHTFTSLALPSMPTEKPVA